MKAVNKGAAFEQVFVTVVSGLVLAKGMTHSEFGRRVFKGDDGVRVWRKIRENEGKARRTALSEAFAMAEVLGVDLPSLLWQTYQVFGTSGGVTLVVPETEKARH